MDCAWDRARRALQLLALDPVGLGGAVLRMRASHMRDRVETFLPSMPVRIHPEMSDEALFGGLDITLTLQAGRPVMREGVLTSASLVLLSMAERCAPDLAGKLAQVIDAGQTCFILRDEGATEDESAPDALADRLAFEIAPDGAMPRDWHVDPVHDVPAEATISDESLAAIATLAMQLGVQSLRPTLFAARVAVAQARLCGRRQVEPPDIAVAAALVLAHRATRLPETEDAPEQAQPEEGSPNTGTSEGQDIPQEMLVEAVKAALPAGLIERIARAKGKSADGTNGAGTKNASNRRGRPLPPRQGRKPQSARIDLVATLRSAAPWQPVRRAANPAKPGLHIRASDLRLRRYETHSDRLLIFTVDASGSSAVARLGEAKGAVELLLADAYVKRDHVALIAFRGEGAEVLLPPTRSLVQTKRRLAALPGGGGTPLAAGLSEAARLAQHSRGRGLAPSLVLLTDGRANIALNGTANRPEAQADAETLAAKIRIDGTPSLVIDTGKRPSPALEKLSQCLDGPYMPLPRADAQGVRHAVSLALGA